MFSADDTVTVCYLPDMALLLFRRREPLAFALIRQLAVFFFFFRHFLHGHAFAMPFLCC